MAYSPSEKYPGAVDSDPDYKGGKFRDNNPSTTNNGSPLKAIDRNELLARDEAIMDDAGFDYNGLPDTPQDSQLFKAYKASLGNGSNLLSNHNFLIPSPDDSQPSPSATPTSYPPGYEIFSGVFANETSGISNLTYIDGRVSFSGGDLYFSVPNTGGLERLNADQFVASVADFDGKPRTRGVSFALVGDEYRVTAGIDALSDGVDDTLLGSVKFEQGKVATGHEVHGFDQIKEWKDAGDVRGWGAKGDGGDDSEAFQAANDAVSERNGIFVPGGKLYRIASHVTFNKPIHSDIGCIIDFDYDGSGLWVYDTPYDTRNIIFRCVNSAVKTLNFARGTSYFSKYDRCRYYNFNSAFESSGVYVYWSHCWFEGNNDAVVPRWLPSQSAPSTMWGFEECIFVGNDRGLVNESNGNGANDDLINLHLKNVGFEQNREGLRISQRVWNLTRENCWFEGNTDWAYNIAKSNPTVIGERVHSSDASKTYTGDWASGGGALSGSCTQMGEGGIQARGVTLHDLQQDSFPSNKRASLIQLGDALSYEKEGVYSSLVISESEGQNARIAKVFVPSSATTEADVSRLPAGWTMNKSGVGIYEFTMNITDRPSIEVNVYPTVNLSDEGKASYVAFGNSDAATWNSLKTVNKFRIYIKDNTNSLTDDNFSFTVNYHESGIF